MSEEEVGGRRQGGDRGGAAPGWGGREPGDADLADLLREAADRRLFAGLAWREELRDRVLSSLGHESPPAGGAAPRRRPWASPWLGWGGLVVAGAAAVLILVLAGPLRTGLRLGSPGPASLSRAESGAVRGPALVQPSAEEAPSAAQAPAAEAQQAAQAPAAAAQPQGEAAGTEQPAAPAAGAAAARAEGAAADKGPAGLVLGAEARLQTGGVAVALRVENAPWDSPPPLKVAVVFPGVGERMGPVEGCKREGAAWSCRALVEDVPERARATADLRVIVLLMRPPAEEGGAPAILALARDVRVSR